MNPRLSTQKRKERLRSNHENEKKNDLDTLNIPVSLPTNRQQIIKLGGSARKN